VVGAKSPNDFDKAFAAMSKAHATVPASNLKRIAAGGATEVASADG